MEENSNQQGQIQECPKTYLVWAILTTCLCCLPFGICAIVKAAQVEKFYYTGDYQRAVKASDDAKKYSIIAAVVGVVMSLIGYIIQMYYSLSLD